MKLCQLLVFFAIFLFGPQVVLGQSDLEIAKKFIEYLPKTMHGFSWESGITEEHLEHIRSHDSLYVLAIKETIEWPDSLFLFAEKINLYENYLPVLVTANSEASKQFMKEVYKISSAILDSLSQDPDSIQTMRESKRIKEYSINGMRSLMRSSIIGLTFTNDGAVLDDVMRRYDSIDKYDQGYFLDYIKHFRFVDTKASEWLKKRKINP